MGVGRLCAQHLSQKKSFDVFHRDISTIQLILQLILVFIKFKK